MRTKLAIGFITCLFLLTTAWAQDFNDMVFSGFVELSSDQHDESSDFSQIEVILETEDGKFVEKTLCSQNGFYLLPIYDRKSYVIRVKPIKESKFEPERIAINLIDKSYDEIKKITEKVHNFKFVGFTLANKVQSKQSTTGPAGVKVSLSDSTGKKLNEATTDANGNFEFKGLMAGKYKVTLLADGDDYVIDPSSSLTCDLKWKSDHVCQGSLVVTGFSVKGKVNSENQDVTSYTISLYGAGKTQPIAQSKLDKEGNFAFTNVANGDYELKLKSSSPNNKIEIEPSSHTFTVSNQKVELNNIFRVERFSISGKVVDTKGNGLANVKVTLDGEYKATTDAKGNYVLEKIKFGTYTLEGNNEHLFFEPIHNLKIYSGLETLPNIVLSYLHVCGSVNVAGDSDQGETLKINVYLESKSEKRMAKLDADGTFCFEVKPGTYVVRPTISGAGRDIILDPTMRDITVTNTPLFNLNFTRPRLSVAGKVSFLADASEALRSKTTISLKTISTQKVLQKISLGKDLTFKFSGIIPGTYELHVDNDALCWDKKVINLPLNKNENVSNIEIKQTGYSFLYQTEKPITVQLIDKQNRSESYTLSPSDNQKCLKSGGVYRVIPDECYQYEKKEFTYDSASGTPFQFKPLKNLVKGYIKFNSTIVKQDAALSKDLPQVLPKVLSLKLVSSKKSGDTVLPIKYEKTQGEFLYFAFQEYLAPGSDVEFTPKPDVSKVNNSKVVSFIENLLFYPTHFTTVVPSECNKDQPAVEFEIRPGVVFEGTVEPAVSHYDVTVVDENTGEKVHGPEHLSGAKFKLGPFVDSTKYVLDISKVGYKFFQTIEHTGQNKIKVTVAAQKLSSLEITVVDNQGSPVSGALVFISSTSKKNFLKFNNYTNDTGKFITHEVVKGEYFVRPVLKEYTFEPAQTTVSIVDGGSATVNIKAVRTAFSVYGRVINLNQDGIEKLDVVAVPQDGSIHPTETGTTDKDGKFRIRGLVPGTTYSISVKSDERTGTVKPQSIQVKMQKQDIYNVDFIHFDKPSTYSIQGNVQFSEDFTENDLNELDLVEILLQKDDETIARKTLQRFRYYEFSGIPNSDYKLKVSYRKKKAASTGNEFEVNVDKSEFDASNVVKKNLTVQKTSARAKVQYLHGHNFAAPIIVLIIFFSVFSMDAIKGWFKKEKVERAEKGDKSGGLTPVRTSSDKGRSGSQGRPSSQDKKRR